MSPLASGRDPCSATIAGELRVQCPFDDGQRGRGRGQTWRQYVATSARRSDRDLPVHGSISCKPPSASMAERWAPVFHLFVVGWPTLPSIRGPPLLWWTATRRLSHDFWNKRWTRPHGKRSVLVSRGGTFRFKISRGHERVGAQRKIKRNKG